MLSGITITCFAASYAVTLVLEVSRLLFQLRVRWLVMIGFAGAGLVAHSAYLWVLTREELSGKVVAPLSSWYDWCLMGAWILAVAYLGLAIRRPQNSVGLFLIPLILALIGAAYAVHNLPSFEREQARHFWGFAHGLLLLVGMVAATLSFSAGVMYLIQSYRLKKKLPPRPGLRLPSLEWLHRFVRRSLHTSKTFLAFGILAGVVYNWIRKTTEGGTIPLSDPVIIYSYALFLWLAISTIVELIYRPVRTGRKVVYMTFASFVFLGLVLILVVLGQHGVSPSPAEGQGAHHMPPGAKHLALAIGNGDRP